MKRIGMVVAVEIDAALGEFNETYEMIKVANFVIYKYQLDDEELYVGHSGAGQISAAMMTQLLISKFDVDFILNFGVVGGLTKEMVLAKTCIVERVVHYDFDTSAVDDCEVGRYLDYSDVYLPTTKDIVEKAIEIEPNLKKVTCASGDKFIADKDKKEALHKQFHADICEMEAAAIVLTCNKNNIPCLLIKTVSDSICGGAEEFRQSVNDSAKTCIKIARQIYRQLK